jgi:hypothetical protein
MDRVGMGQVQPWVDLRRELPVGPLLCVLNGATRGRHWSPAAARAELRRTAAAAGAAPIRAAPAPPRPCRRDGPRRRAAQCHPTPTRTRQPRHHIRLLARHRQRRDRRDRPRPTRASDPCQRVATALIDSAARALLVAHCDSGCAGSPLLPASATRTRSDGTQAARDCVVVGDHDRVPGLCGRAIAGDERVVVALVAEAQ